MSKKAVTSKRAATVSSHVLRSKEEDASAKTSAGSALAQAPEHKSPKKLVFHKPQRKG
jgi:hypothetical protein